MMNFLIVGSSFGLNSYYPALKNKKNIFTIVSPNIFKKKINKKVFIFNNFKIALDKKKYDYLICAAPPKVQEKIIKYIYLKKISFTGIILEKPIASSYKKQLEIFSCLDKINIPYIINFIFPQIFLFKKLKKLINQKNFNFLNYKFFFNQGYFLNHKKTWKIKNKLGGGIVYFYLIHIFYNLLFLFNNFVLSNIKVIKKEKKENIFTYLEIEATINKYIKLSIVININSSLRLHSIETGNSKKKFKLINKSFDWTRNFSLYNKKVKIYKKSKEKRLDLIKKNFLLLQTMIKKKNNNKKNYYNKFLLAHSFCNKIEKIIY